MVSTIILLGSKMNYIKTNPKYQSNIFIHGFIGKEFPKLEHWDPNDQFSQDNVNKVCNDLNKPNAKLILVNQKHTSLCQVINDQNFVSGSIEADAMATKNQSLILAVRTADCVPVLFLDDKNRNIAIAHAGWKGALSGVIADAFTKMNTLGSRNKDITILTGPCIGQQDYEVGEEFYQSFVEHDQANKRFFIPAANNKFFFSLPEFVQSIIVKQDIKELLMWPETTYGSKIWYSYREAFHQHKKPDGHILSFVGFK